MTAENTNAATEIDTEIDESLALVMALPQLSIRPEQVKFRYVGDVSLAREGVITLATYKDDLRNEMRVGICYTRPGEKFDAEFARTVSMLRLPNTVFPAGVLEAKLDSVQGRVKKTSAKRRLTLDERETIKRLAKDEEHRGAGYYTYDFSYYTVADFADPEYRYGFLLTTDDLDGAEKHSEIDEVILNQLTFHNVSGQGLNLDWINDKVSEALSEIEDNRAADDDVDTDNGDEDGDEFDFENEDEVEDDGLLKLTQLNTSNARVELASVVDGEVFLLATDEEGDRAAASPIFSSVDALKAWLGDAVTAIENGVTVTDLGSDEEEFEDDESFSGDDDDDTEDSNEESEDDDADEESEDEDEDEA